MRGPRTEHGCVMCGCHWENEVYRDETGGTDHAYALLCLASQRLISDSLISITNQHHNTQVDTSTQVSGRHSTLPFNTAAAEILRAAAEEGQDMQIVLPDPSIQHPYLILPLEVATRIMEGTINLRASSMLDDTRG